MLAKLICLGLLAAGPAVAAPAASTTAEEPQYTNIISIDTGGKAFDGWYLSAYSYRSQGKDTYVLRPDSNQGAQFALDSQGYVSTAKPRRSGELQVDPQGDSYVYIDSPTDDYGIITLSESKDSLASFKEVKGDKNSTLDAQNIGDKALYVCQVDNFPMIYYSANTVTTDLCVKINGLNMAQGNAPAPPTPASSGSTPSIPGADGLTYLTNLVGMLFGQDPKGSGDDSGAAKRNFDMPSPTVIPLPKYSGLPLCSKGDTIDMTKPTCLPTLDADTIAQILGNNPLAQLLPKPSALPPLPLPSIIPVPIAVPIQG